MTVDIEKLAVELSEGYTGRVRYIRWALKRLLAHGYRIER